MNVYDFDGTIYRGDSSVDFFVYCITRFPWILLLLPYQLMMIGAYKIGLCSKECEKSAFFTFLRVVPDVNSVVQAFWRTRKKKIAEWYLAVKKEDDVVISASPRFLLSCLCSELGIRNLIASEVDIRIGRFCGQNCYGREKVRRFCQLFPDARIEKFYSDSQSDSPMALLACQAYMVKNGNISNWHDI